MRQLMAKGLHVMGMIKDMKQRYQLGDKHLSLRELSAVFSQLQQWIMNLPSYIKGLFTQLSCES